MAFVLRYDPIMLGRLLYGIVTLTCWFMVLVRTAVGRPNRVCNTAWKIKHLCYQQKGKLLCLLDRTFIL